MKIQLVLLIAALSSFCLSAQGTNKIAILDFNTSGVSENEMLLFTDFIATRISQDSGYILIDRRQRDNILSELSFSNSGCTDEECQLEIGRLLSANIIVVGSIGSIGSVYLLNMHLVNVETSETIQTVSEQYDSLDLLVRDSENLVVKLLDRNMDHPESEGEAAVLTGSDSSVIEKTEGRTVPLLLSGLPLTRGTSFWKGSYYMDGPDLYYQNEFPGLGEMLSGRINTPEASALFNEYTAEAKAGSNLMWGALACSAGGLLLAVNAMNNDESYGSGELPAGAVAGLAIELVGVVMVFVSGSRNAKARTAFDGLVDLYNLTVN